MASLNPLSGTLGHRRAAHLLRRASYHYIKATVDNLANMTATQAAESLVVQHPLLMEQPIYADPSVPGEIPVPWINPPGAVATDPNTDPQKRQFVASWWMNEAANDAGIGHKMEFFYHQFMATSLQTISSATYFDYLALIRYYSLGSFKTLALKMVKDNIMISYLNNQQNTKANPNANFAREFFELFTIGKGPEIGQGDYTHYTENDILEAARLFTGWRLQLTRELGIDADTGIPGGRAVIAQHDTGTKQFSSKFQNTTIAGTTTAVGMQGEVQQLVDMIFNQLQTARTLVRRLYLYFVGRHITAEIETDIIEPLAVQLKNGNYQVAPVLKKLLASEHFFDADNSSAADQIIGGMIKSPLELSLQAISFFGMPIPDASTNNNVHYMRWWANTVRQRMQSMAGLNIFFPSDVAGYPAYYQEPDYNRSWFNSSAVIARYKLAEIILSGKYTIGGNPQVNSGSKLNIAQFVRFSGVVSAPQNAEILVQDLVKYLLPETPDAQRMSYFINDILLTNLPTEDWTYEWETYLTTNNAAEVTIGLERLIKSIMYSPEYQLF